MAKKRRSEECPERNENINKAEEISKEYGQLSKCCDLLSHIKCDDEMTLSSSLYSGGWRINAYTLESAGIDMDDIYEYIEKLTKRRKLELECKLSKLDI